ncbi:MAG: hypothetical protein U5K54_04475 [Cytophagales bacterium]|nr:hypothetical protein [Cytophagales bacterium]
MLLNLVAAGHSEEHLILKAKKNNSYKVGDVLYGVPSTSVLLWPCTKPWPLLKIRRSLEVDRLQPEKEKLQFNN